MQLGVLDLGFTSRGQLSRLVINLCFAGNGPICSFQDRRIEKLCQVSNPDLLETKTASERCTGQIVLDDRAAFALQACLLRTCSSHVHCGIHGESCIWREILESDIDMVIEGRSFALLLIEDRDLSVADSQL